MKFLPASIFLILFCALSSAAQEICDLKTESAPSPFGLKLQMSPIEVQAVFGKDFKIKYKKDGERTFFRSFIKKPPPPSLPNVRALYLRFFNRRLYQIEVFYQSGDETRDEFAAAIIEKYHLPALFKSNKNNQLELNCTGFTVVTDVLPNPKIEITDQAIFALVTEARKKAAEKAK